MKTGHIFIIMTLFIFATTQLLHAENHQRYYQHSTLRASSEHENTTSGCKAIDPRCSDRL
ncbi:MAG: hypothetical protein KBC28_02660 [Alphaproteobacteria bacterium]|jgi:hypothetical protein|nr:hypothetical protein [Alphaproteobacteria bacterium]